MKEKRSPAPDSSMNSISGSCCYKGDDVDQRYTHDRDWQMNLNRPTVRQDAAAINVEAAFNAGLVLRQKL